MNRDFGSRQERAYHLIWSLTSRESLELLYESCSALILRHTRFQSKTKSVTSQVENDLCVSQTRFWRWTFLLWRNVQNLELCSLKKSNDLSDTENFRQSPRSSAILKYVIDVKYHYKNTQNVTCDVNILINYKIRNPDTTSGQNAVNCYEFRQMTRQARKVIPSQNIKILSLSLTQIISRTDVISQEKMIKLCSSAFRSFSFCIHNTIRTHPSFPPDSFWKFIQLDPVQRCCSHCSPENPNIQIEKDRRRPTCRDTTFAKFEQAQQ